mgnify:CR=1 FL=1
MDRNELINDIVRAYFEGKNWKKYTKELVKELRTKEEKV